MLTPNSLAVAFAVGLSTVLASQVLAQPNVSPPPPLTGKGPAKLSEHRKAALKKCTNQTSFDSDRYVACMTKEGEAP
jgi:hypothetical protein